MSVPKVQHLHSAFLIRDGALIEVHPPDESSRRWSVRLGEGDTWLHMSRETLQAINVGITRALEATPKEEVTA